MIRALVIGALALAACGGGNSPPPAQPTLPPEPAPAPASDPPPVSTSDAALVRMHEFETAMCACTDVDCVQRVADDMARWAKELEDEHREPTRMDEAQTRRASEMGQHLGECMQRAMSGRATAPDAGSSTP